MLYSATIGTVPPEHPELQAFMKGLRLPCANGFTFLVVSAWSIDQDPHPMDLHVNPVW